MPWIEYKSGVAAPDGYEERLSGYQCDRTGCKQEAEEPYDFEVPGSGLCDTHRAEMFTEEEEMARLEREYRDYEQEQNT